MLPRIPKTHRAGTDDQSCVWSAVCLLVKSKDTEKGRQLMDYQCMFMGTTMRMTLFHNSGGGKRRRGISTDRVLSDLVANYGLMLKRVSCTEPDRLKYIQQPGHEGMYVCVLCSSPSYNVEHCVGIDTTVLPNIIWDANEPMALELTEKSLDKCCGYLQRYRKIKYIGELQFTTLQAKREGGVRRKCHRCKKGRNKKRKVYLKKKKKKSLKQHPV